jgi:hypothetical protein
MVSLLLRADSVWKTAVLLMFLRNTASIIMGEEDVPTVQAGYIGSQMRDEQLRRGRTDEGFCTSMSRNICYAPILESFAHTIT